MKISNLRELDELPVSHDPQLKKKVMVKNGVVPHLTNFSQAKIPPNESVSSHQHQDMYEIFFVNSGEGVITINSQEYHLTRDTCIVIEPKEEHSLKNTGDSDLILTYFGLA
jgi:mannose-6-phosphate isomerase-like protein (cupin superfamily)